MSDAAPTPAPVPQPPAGDDAVLAALVPESSAERRRAFSALLRAITDNRVLLQRGTDEQR